MKTIWKFPLDADLNRIEMPAGATLLHVDSQNNKPWLWAMVDPDAKRVTRRVYFTGTGVPFSDGCAGKHVGTFLMSLGEA